ncbi:lysosomal-trafficking regulator isoform X2 [Daktulosphaira vitifoliae]|uniref:lysosomal-trafficking regulator isoform X2 n=1 Tax=Daktulosphaira vitifoliae TaxID=58002 RepID=UPI0021AAD183|nr:lysosomal-trafficking regulator isoform X2 [Daktulosphaira vitifoliae]
MDYSIPIKPSKIDIFWEAYLNCKATEGTTLKNDFKIAWFDLLLSEILLVYDKTKKIPEDIPKGNVTNALVGQLLCDIDSICSISEEEDFSCLKKYILSDRGWRCLTVLHLLGTQDIQQLKEFSNVLISMYNMFNEDTDAKIINDLSLTQNNLFPFESDEFNVKLDDLIKLTKFQGIKSKSKNSVYDRSSPSLPRSRRVSAVSANRFKNQSNDVTKGNKVEESSESECLTMSDLPKSNTLRIRFNPMDFDYFTSVVRSEDEHDSVDGEYISSNKINSVDPGYFFDDHMKKITNSSSTPCKIKLLILDLLTQILSKNTHPQIKCTLKDSHQFVPFIIMKFSLDNIAVLQFDPCNLYDNKILSKMLYNMVLSVKQLHLCPNISETITQEGIIPLLIQILEGLVNKTRASEIKENVCRQKILFGVLCTLLMVFSMMLFECYSYNSHFHFLKQIRVMLDCQRGKLIEKCIYVMLCVRGTEISTGHIKIVVNLLGLLVLNMKKIRQRMVHVQECSKVRHRHCTKIMMHHHDKLFGAVYVSNLVSSQDMSQNCCVTSLSMILIRILINLECSDKELWFYLVKTIGVAGTCCCIPFSAVLPKLFKVISENDSKKSSMILQLLEKTLYRDAGAAYKDSSCKVCDDENNIVSYEKSKIKKEQKWSTFEIFRKLLNGPNMKLSQSISLHLSKNAPVFIKEVQHILLFRIFYPVFKTSEKSYIKNKNETDLALLNVSLNIFNILLVSLDFTSEFDSMSGVKYLKELITDPVFTKLCCNVLETKIMTKMWTLNQIKSTPILITDSQAEDLNVIVNAVFNLLELFCGYVMKPHPIEINLKFKYSLSVLSDVLHDEIIFDSITKYQNYNSVISRLGDLFQCLARLSLTCPRIRSYLQVSSVIHQYDTLLSIVSLLLVRPIIVEGKNEVAIEDKNVVNLKLIECLLVLNLSIFENKITLDTHVKDLLIEALSKGHIGIKQVCSSLIRCATVSTNRHNTQCITTALSLTKLLDNETSVKTEWIPFDDDNFNSGDEGYDADIEFQSWMNIDSSDKTADEVICHKIYHSDTKRMDIMHPALCTLAVDLMTFAKNLDNTEGIIYCLQRLIAICKDNDESCVKLAKEGLIFKLLGCIKDYIINTEKNSLYDTIYIYMTELIALMACHYMEKHELQTYLNMFKKNNPPLNLILLPLMYLMDHIQVLWQPHYSLKFPTEVISDIPISDRPAEALAILTRENHTEMRLLTPWSIFAMSLPINTDLGWSILSTGFSVSLWLNVEHVHKCPNIKYNNSLESLGKIQSLNKDSASLDDLTHLLSIGFDAMLLEFWVNPNSDGLIARLSRPNETKFDLLSEVNFSNCISLNAWHHVAINTNGIKKGEKYIEISIIVDGLCENKAKLSFTGFFIKKPRPSNVLLGDTRKNAPPISIGNIMMFRLPVLTKECACTLAAFGPDLENLADCSNNLLKPNFSMLFKDTVYNLNLSLNSGMNWNQISSQCYETMKPLQDVILLSFTPRDPNTVCLYSLTLPHPTGALFPPSQPLMFKMALYDLRACQSPPIVVSTVVVSSIKVLKPHGFLTAVNNLGGIPLLLFLLARVLELNSSSDDEQEKTLKILLHFINVNSKLYSEFIMLDGYKLLTKILTSSRIKPNCTMLMALLEAGCNKKGAFVRVSDEWIVNRFYEGVLLNTSYIKDIILPSWKIWSKKNNQAIKFLFKFFKHLLSSNHPHNKFNLKQLQSSELLEAILLQLKCQLLLEDSNETSLSSCVQKDLVDFVQNFFDLDMNINYLTMILDFLIAVHPTSNLYSPHLKSSVYFILTPQSKTISESSYQIYTPSESCESNINKLHLEDYSETDFCNSNNTMKLNKEILKLQIEQDLIKNSYSKIILSRMSDETSDSSEHVIPEETGQDSGIDGSVKDVGIALNPSEKEASCDADVLEAEIYFESQTKSNENNQFKLTDTDSNCEFIEGLFSILRNVLINMPSSISGIVLEKIFNLEKFVILLNNPSPKIRIIIIKIVNVFLQRCSPTYAKKFSIKFKGFYQMANVLALHHSTIELVDACAALFSGSYWLPLDEQLQWDQAVDMSSFNFAALPLLLSLLPKSAFNITLCTSIINFFIKVITKVPQALNILIDYGLIECLLKTLSVIACIYPSSQTHTDLSKHEILIDDINSLIITLITSAIHSPGVQNIQILNDAVYQCRYLQNAELQTSTEGYKSNLILRETQRFILESGMDTIQELIQTQPPPAPALSRLKKNISSVLSLNQSKDTNEYTSISTSESSLFSVASSFYRQKILSRAELIERYKNIINRSVEFIFAPNVDCSDETTPEVPFACHLLNTFMYNLSSIITSSREQRQTPWLSIYSAARDIIRIQGANLLVWLLSPQQINRIRIFAVESLTKELRTREFFKNVIYINPQTEQRFFMYLSSLMNADLSIPLTEEEMYKCEILKECLFDMELLTSENNSLGYENEWTTQINTVLKTMNIELNEVYASQNNNIINVCKWDNIVKSVCDSASSLTTCISEEQNIQRKQLLEKTKENFRNTIQATLRWKSIINQMSHEKAPWYFPESYPTSWELNPIEGPNRIRNRLQRCNLKIAKKFIKSEYAKKIVDKEGPLDYLLSDDLEVPISSAVVESLLSKEKISYMCTAKLILLWEKIKCEILISENSIYIVPMANSQNTIQDEYSHVLKFDEVKEIHNRRYSLKEKAIEIFLVNGKTFLIAFHSQQERDDFSNYLLNFSLPNRITSEILSETVNLWRSRQITNLEYLAILNKMAARSYNDLMQYPVMPFVLASYSGKELDLNQISTYRELRRPMAIQNKKKEAHYIQHYNYLKEEVQRFGTDPHHYSSHYSNSGTVLHFLIRVPPYTQMFIKYQDNNFDVPDRSFHSMEITWRLSSDESTTDLKELIPEFYYLPEMFINFEQLNFGAKQSGEIVDDVLLPAWAQNNPRLFVLIHRQLLESEIVSENLPHWIDLIFGYKQTGKAAIDAINVFHPATYYGSHIEETKDPLARSAFKTMVNTYGQTPRQLFRSPHPMTIDDYSPKNLMKHTSCPNVISGVKNLKWGNYVGSPEEYTPINIWKSKYETRVCDFVPLLTNDVFGLSNNSALILTYSKEKSLTLLNEGVTIMGVAILSWSHADGLVRIKQRKEAPYKPALKFFSGEIVSKIATAPHCPFIWIGFESGLIHVYKFYFDVAAGNVMIFSEPYVLVGHRSKITCISVNPSFSIAVSCGQDGSAIIWDLNSVTYVRSLQPMSSPINLVAISETLGDIVTISYNLAEEKSTMTLHTINASFVGSMKSDKKITSVCFSNAPEGVSVNVIATGYEDGSVKLWSTWDLTYVSEIPINNFNGAVLAIIYSRDSQHLYISTEDDTVTIWESSGSKRISKTPKFLNLSML